jgi:hypothetical protein
MRQIKCKTDQRDGRANVEQVERGLGLNPSFSTHGVGEPGSRSRSTSWSKGLYHRGDVLVLIQKLSARANAGWRLGRQREVELFEQEYVIGLWMGVAA